MRKRDLLPPLAPPETRWQRVAYAVAREVAKVNPVDILGPVVLLALVVLVMNVGV